MRKLLGTTAEYAIRYLEGLGTRTVAPMEVAIANLIQFDEPLLILRLSVPKSET